jgi:hypothetical protein
MVYGAWHGTVLLQEQELVVELENLQKNYRALLSSAKSVNSQHHNSECNNGSNTHNVNGSSGNGHLHLHRQSEWVEKGLEGRIHELSLLNAGGVG